ncbi:hypothetical protein GL218_03833 [Daldinia childiae]|uniref:uncharacterized protein n=1 Tax=Daldinia childiae TaxID=326645 RepID=UPI0014472642|nr:uncharacterized protein GL218_03833 [Daldinia childiae]KAF3062431.1 hypothetical protein GL218_03833 [Daldinia childiae]
MVGTNEVDFHHLKTHGSRYLGTIGVRVLELLESALKLSPPTSPESKAAHFVHNLMKFSSIEESGLEPEDFVWQFWDYLINIASQVPPCSPEQDVLVETVILLEVIGEGDKPKNQLWKDLGDFDIAVRETWNLSPTVQNKKDSYELTESEWLNLNSFMARIHDNQTGWGKFPIWELHDGLESPLSPQEYKPTPDTRVRVAIEWILRSSCRLLLDSLLHSYSDYPEGPDKGYPYRCGPLYSGVSGCSLERWCFWKRRLSEIKAEVSEDLHSAIDEAIETMIRTEKDLGERAKLSITQTISRAESKAEIEAKTSSTPASDEPKENTMDKGGLPNNDTVVDEGYVEEDGDEKCNGRIE